MCVRCGESLQVFQASATALQLSPFRCRFPALRFLPSGVILRQSRHVGSQAFCLLQSFHSRCTSILFCGEHLVVKSRRSLHDCRGVHWIRALSALFTDVRPDLTKLTSTQSRHGRNLLSRSILSCTSGQMRFGEVAEFQHAKALGPGILRLDGR